MMQMLAAAGLPIHQDHARGPDPSNPQGYFELERVKLLPDNPDVLEDLGDGAVKVIYALAYLLPSSTPYKFVVMDRDPQEVLDSQARMLKRLGRPAPTISVRALADELEAFQAWVDAQPNVDALRVSHRALMRGQGIAAVAEFIGVPDAAERMASCIQPTLWRARV